MLTFLLTTSSGHLSAMAQTASQAGPAGDVAFQAARQSPSYPRTRSQTKALPSLKRRSSESGVTGTGNAKPAKMARKPPLPSAVSPEAVSDGAGVNATPPGRTMWPPDVPRSMLFSFRVSNPSFHMCTTAKETAVDKATPPGDGLTSPGTGPGAMSDQPWRLTFLDPVNTIPQKTRPTAATGRPFKTEARHTPIATVLVLPEPVLCSVKPPHSANSFIPTPMRVPNVADENTPPSLPIIDPRREPEDPEKLASPQKGFSPPFFLSTNLEHAPQDVPPSNGHSGQDSVFPSRLRRTQASPSDKPVYARPLTSGLTPIFTGPGYLPTPPLARPIDHSRFAHPSQARNAVYPPRTRLPTTLGLSSKMYPASTLHPIPRSVGRIATTKDTDASYPSAPSLPPYPSLPPPPKQSYPFTTGAPWSALYDSIKLATKSTRVTAKRKRGPESMHQSELPTALTETSSRDPHRCPFCPRTFSLPNGLAIHLKWHWGATGLDWKKGINKNSKTIERALRDAERRREDAARRQREQDFPGIPPSLGLPVNHLPVTTNASVTDFPQPYLSSPFAMPVVAHSGLTAFDFSLDVHPTQWPVYSDSPYTSPIEVPHPHAFLHHPIIASPSASSYLYDGSHPHTPDLLADTSSTNSIEYASSAWSSRTMFGNDAEDLDADGEFDDEELFGVWIPASSGSNSYEQQNDSVSAEPSSDRRIRRFSSRERSGEPPLRLPPAFYHDDDEDDEEAETLITPGVDDGCEPEDGIFFAGFGGDTRVATGERIGVVDAGSDGLAPLSDFMALQSLPELDAFETLSIF
ncbi:hypothetical protein BN946_scf184790.g5 [Trametes cinnabarina]|uniref:C2H2-type domain-containing protein n=1 Tax=Pycnoporus cinnabarinus TaxID=5643 RepID=A0A060S384_PYCCI|nr:hypothetical protein BN946_scf184790.g5 [Trametes cinnabarina]